MNFPFFPGENAQTSKKPYSLIGKRIGLFLVCQIVDVRQLRCAIPKSAIRWEVMLSHSRWGAWKANRNGESLFWRPSKSRGGRKTLEQHIFYPLRLTTICGQSFKQHHGYEDQKSLRDPCP